MSSKQHRGGAAEPRQIECLACGETRVVFGTKTGECPQCRYVGWTFSDELDSMTRRKILNGEFAVCPVPPRPARPTVAKSRRPSLRP